MNQHWNSPSVTKAGAFHKCTLDYYKQYTPSECLGPYSIILALTTRLEKETKNKTKAGWNAIYWTRIKQSRTSRTLKNDYWTKLELLSDWKEFVLTQWVPGYFDCLRRINQIHKPTEYGKAGKISVFESGWVLTNTEPPHHCLEQMNWQGSKDTKITLKIFILFSLT